MDATTGAIGLFNPAGASFTPSAFTVTEGSALQPYIDSFSPASGPVGTVVTILGTGFTGLNAAWVGDAHDGLIQVISDNEVQVAIPADATTGAIGILNSVNASFTPYSFVVTAPVQYPQPYIDSFSPASGAPGTVVTILGSGFTGSNAAWVGNAHDALVQVISDSEVQVTIPVDATSGAIGILNPSNASFTPYSFTVTQ